MAMKKKYENIFEFRCSLNIDKNMQQCNVRNVSNDINPYWMQNRNSTTYKICDTVLVHTTFIKFVFYTVTV